jgi:hypothetical protein
MSWQQTDEFIDLERARHVVIYKNRDTGAEHQLIHEFMVQACPHCGSIDSQGLKLLDMEEKKTKTLASLNAHHKAVMAYRAKYPRVSTVSLIKK